MFANIDLFLSLHSLNRWLVLISLLGAIYRAYQGKKNQLPFTPADNAIRHWTATIAHIQLILGIILYSQSPITRYFFKNFSSAIHEPDIAFISIIHMTLMLIAIVLITIGSALAKRKNGDNEKFSVMLTWFSIALLIILLAIPWPFSPLAPRPYLRPL